MIWRLMLLLVCGPAAAEIGTIDRLQDCLGPRALAGARELFLAAPCQDDKSCGAFDASLYSSESEITCSIETLSICVTSKDAKCLTDLESFMEFEIARIRHEFPDQRIDELAVRYDGLQKWFIETKKVSLAEPVIFDCPDQRAWPISAFSKEEGCKFHDLIIAFSTVRGVERTILKREAELP